MRILITYILCLIASLTYAQEIIIQPPLFAPFECTEFYKLYTGSVTNFSQETFETKLLLEVDYTSPSGSSFRLADGILSGNPSTDFAPGTIVINNTNYERLYSSRNITFYDKNIENLLSRTKCLPPGQYDVCLTLVRPQSSDSPQEILTQTCYTREKQMLSQLLLVSPFEGDEVAIEMPLFTWTPVTPINPGAMYRIQIVEMLANQTPFEAFRSNPIFYEQSGLMSNIFQYPVSARMMLPCTQYAWRVTYELRGGFVSTAFQKSPDFLQESEIWEFSKPCDEEEEEEEEEITIPQDKYYYKPSFSKASMIHDHVGKDFWFEIDNPYQSRGKITIQIEDENGEKRSVECCDPEVESSDDDTVSNAGNIISGLNYLHLDLEKYGFVPGQYYKLFILDFKNPLFINFKYKEDEK